MSTSSHYSPALQPEKMREVAQSNAARLKDHVGDATPVLCFAGLSGTAAAMVLAQYIEGPVAMIYARKEGEYHDCHGNRVEVHVPVEATAKMLVFCDDFVSTGNTLERVMVAAIRTLERSGREFNREKYVRAITGDRDGYTRHGVETHEFKASWFEQAKEKEA